MTLKQKRFIKALPTSKSISEAARKAGYSESSANSKIYTTVRNSKSLKEYFDEELFWKDYKKLRRELSKTKDYTNRLRLQELYSKILGLITDKHQEVAIDKSDNQFSLDRLAGIKRNEN